MAAEWIPVVIDVGIGGAAGAVDQVLQNQDDKRRRDAEAAGETLSVWKKYGTYFNYGVPVLAILGVAFNFLKGSWATRAVTAGSQLAGRKMTYQFTKATQATPWREYIPPTRQPAPQPPGGGSRLEF